jgi:hypothetical protein
VRQDRHRQLAEDGRPVIVRKRLGDKVFEPLRALARVHDEAAYAPASVHHPVADDPAQAAWRLAREFRTALARELPRRRRILAHLDPRPLAHR